MDDLMGVIVNAKNLPNKKIADGAFGEQVGQLPMDYLELCRKVGSGFEVDGRMIIQSPEKVSEYREYHQNRLRIIHGDGAIYFSGGRRVLPEESVGGSDKVMISNLTHWGSDDNGSMVFWDSVGPVDEWSIVATDCSDAWIRYCMTSVEYLYGIFSRRIKCPVFTADSWPSLGGVNVCPFGP